MSKERRARVRLREGEKAKVGEGSDEGGMESGSAGSGPS
jgi:hypothetical protein